MPGTALTIDYPVDGDNFATTLAKLTAAIAQLADDLAPRITAGELDIDTELSMNGAPLTNVGGVRLIGGTSAVVGTIYMDEELHAVTTDGNIQITANGALNVTALGTIGGDYGGFNPAAVKYVDIGGRYTFEEGPGVWADVYVDDIMLNGVAGTVSLGVAPSFAGNVDIVFKDFPVSAGLLAYNPVDGTLSDATATTVTVGGAVFTNDIDVGTHRIKHADQTVPFSLYASDVIESVVTCNRIPGHSGVAQDIGSGSAYYKLPVIPSNHRLKTLRIFVSSNPVGNNAFLKSINSAGVWTTVDLVGPDSILGSGGTYSFQIQSPVEAVQYVVGIASAGGAISVYGGAMDLDAV